MRRKTTIGFVIVLLCWHVFPASADRVDLLVPAYANPCCGGGPLLWSTLIATAGDAGLDIEVHVIFNPDNGPGTAVDPNYVDAQGNGPLLDLRNAGGFVHGYVPTGFGTRPATAVEADVDRYYDALYPGIVDGIFFDEMTNDLASVGYYQQLRDYVKGKDPGALVIGNPGTTFTNNPSMQTMFDVLDYADSADVLTTFENTGAQYETNYSPPAWLATFPPRRFAHILHSQPSWGAAFLALAHDRSAGFLFVTDDVFPNPFDALPSFWSAKTAAISAHNVPEPDARIGTLVAFASLFALRRRHEFSVRPGSSGRLELEGSRCFMKF